MILLLQRDTQVPKNDYTHLQLRQRVESGVETLEQGVLSNKGRLIECAGKLLVLINHFEQVEIAGGGAVCSREDEPATKSCRERL